MINFKWKEKKIVNVIKIKLPLDKKNVITKGIVFYKIVLYF